MSFVAVLRAPARRAAFVASPARLRAPTRIRNSFRQYSSAPEPKSSNVALYGAIGAAALAAGAYYVYASSSDTAKEAGTAVKSATQAVKVKTNFVPTKEDYQTVSNSDFCDSFCWHIDIFVRSTTKLLICSRMSPNTMVHIYPVQRLQKID